MSLLSRIIGKPTHEPINNWFISDTDVITTEKTITVKCAKCHKTATDTDDPKRTAGKLNGELAWFKFHCLKGHQIIVFND